MSKSKKEKKLSEKELEERRIFEEQKKALEERAERLRKMSNSNLYEDAGDIENIPAYLRKGIDIEPNTPFKSRRLLAVAKEFNIPMRVVKEFLQKNGFELDYNNPNVHLTTEMYEAFKQEFSQDKLSMSMVGEAIPNFEKLEILIEKGTTPDEEVASILAELSLLYRMAGGSGINFEFSGILNLENEAAWTK